MKKVLLTLMVLGITSSSMAFGYEIQYMNTGAPKIFTPVAFGSNAPWLPGNREMQGYKSRAIRRYNAETHAIKNRNNYNINLNLNTNSNSNNLRTTESYSANAPTTTTATNTEAKTKQKFTSATCHGITYYSENNPCSL
jgi:hypothetical protein